MTFGPAPDAPAPDAPDRRPSRRASLLGLLIPFLILAVALGGWTWWWFAVAHEVERGLDRTAADFRQAGYRVSWKGRSVSGWPFRTFVRFEDFRVGAPSGHAFYAPKLHAEANAYQLDKWVASAPDGFTFVRASKGAVTVRGEGLRASLSHPKSTPPTLVIELAKPVFTTTAEAEPFPFASADLVAFNLEARPGDPGAAAFAFRIEGGKPRPDGMLDWIGGGESFTTRWEGLVSNAGAFSGEGWEGAARNWSRAGGKLTQVRGNAQTGAASAQASSAGLAAGPDGRLRGSLDLSVTGGPQSLMAMARSKLIEPTGAAMAAAATSLAGGLTGSARVRLDFTGDGAKLGPARLSDSPRIY
jgi:hypothetical protein